MKFWSERMPFLAQFAQDHRVLHLGPGREPPLGITVDRLPALRPSVLADLDRPLPFRDDSFDAVYAFSVIEHLSDLFRALAEVHRVLRPGGFVALLTPHFSNDASFVDPSHRLHLSARSFDYFVEGTDVFRDYGFTAAARFRPRLRLLMLEPPWCHLPGLQELVNRNVTLFERHLCYLVRGRGLYLELEASK